MPDISDRICKYIRQEGMPPPGETILVALSGGADSVALLLLMKGLGYRLVAGHCNFGLRAAAEADEAFVVALAEAHGISLKIWHFGPQDFERYPGEGIQQAARKLRYEAFETYMATEGISHCATGHHAGDQAETLLLSFFRGLGPRLLQGIPPIRGPFFRPLLCLAKEELTDWLAGQGQAWRHDESNDSDKYARNIVRNRLIPVLRSLHPKFEERFEMQAKRHDAHWALLAALFEPLVPMVTGKEASGFWISMQQFGARMGEEHFPVFLDWWLDGMGCSGTEVHEIQRLVKSNSGATYIGVHWEVLRDRDRLRFRERSLAASPGTAEISVIQAEDHCIEFAGVTLHLHRRPLPLDFKSTGEIETHWMQWSSVSFPLRLRKWERGDRYRPLGSPGNKKLSDIFIDQKRDRFSKEHAWVLEDAAGIVLVGGYRIADRVALSPEAADCLCIEAWPSM